MHWINDWTLLFSIYALNGILPDSHLQCWRIFVLACRKMCYVLISCGNAKVADRLLMEFCQRCESLLLINMLENGMSRVLLLANRKTVK
jgi:hypothetical protein